MIHLKKRIPKRYAIEIINKMLTGFCPLVFRLGEQEPFLYTLKSDEKQFLNAYETAQEYGYQLKVDSSGNVFLIKGRKQELIYAPSLSLKKIRKKLLIDELTKKKVMTK